MVVGVVRHIDIGVGISIEVGEKKTYSVAGRTCEVPVARVTVIEYFVWIRWCAEDDRLERIVEFNSLATRV